MAILAMINLALLIANFLFVRRGWKATDRDSHIGSAGL